MFGKRELRSEIGPNLYGPYLPLSGILWCSLEELTDHRELREAGERGRDDITAAAHGLSQHN